MIPWKLKQSGTWQCVNSGLLKYDILIKAVIPVSIVVYWMMIFWLKQSEPVSMVVYWMMIFWLKQSYTWKLKQSDTCVNGGLLNDDILIKTKWYMCQWSFIKWW